MTATCNLYATLPNPVKRARRPGINFTPHHGRLARTKATNASTPPHCYAEVQIMCTLGIVRLDQTITATGMRAYDGLFAAPLYHDVLAALIDQELPANPTPPPCTPTLVMRPRLAPPPPRRPRDRCITKKIMIECVRPECPCKALGDPLDPLDGRIVNHRLREPRADVSEQDRMVAAGSVHGKLIGTLSSTASTTALGGASGRNT